jgi:cytochrome c-type biogenesis protein CcsB
MTPDRRIMPTDASLASLSDTLTNAATALYALAALTFAAVFAYRRAKAPAAASLAHIQERALVGAGGPPLPQPPGTPPADERPNAVFTADSLGRHALGLTVLGWLAHLGALGARSFAAGHPPWANMYEFVSAVVFAAVTALLVLFSRNRAYYLGAFVMFPALVGMGLATTTLYTPVSPLQASLHSYWLGIHVLAAVAASGGFTVATALSALQLYRGVHRDTTSEQQGPTIAALAARLPATGTLERLARQTVMFAFPVWTFAIIAGAIWADNAWGRYWGWDPKETWAFITWVVYAAYLHAQSTTGWRGRKAALISIAAYACLLYNLIGINIWGSGLHSYAGV